MADVTPEMEQAKARVEERLLALPGVTGVDIGFKEVGGEVTDQLAIRVLVREKKSLDEVPEEERIPEEIEGHPADVIQRRFELHSVGASVAEDELPSPVDAGVYSPVRGGISVGPCRTIGGFVHAGTLGAIVVDNASKRPLALSNFHVLAVDEHAADGDAIVQPSRIEGGQCPAQVAGKLRRHALTGSVDAAVMDLAVEQGVRPEVVEIGAVTGTGTATLGQAVRKRGRTTRLTYGVVDSVSLTVIVDYGPGIGEKTLAKQIGVRPDPDRSAKFSDHGDSGSVVVGDAREVVGLLFAGDETGYGVANPIADVLSALDIDIATAPAAKRVEPAANTKILPEFKERFGGKERKSDKTEFKDDKDQKNEDKEIKDLKDEEKENKDGKDLKDEPDKAGKDETKEFKDKREKPEFKNESKDEGKESKDKQEKDENKESKEEKESKDNKDKEDKEAKDKAEKTEFKESKEVKDGGKENKDSPFEIMGQTGQDPMAQRIAALEATVARLTAAVTGDQEPGGAPGVGPGKDLKPEKDKAERLEKPEKEKVEKFEKVEKTEKNEKFEKSEKLEGKDKDESKESKDLKDQVKEKPERKELKEAKDNKDQTKERKEKPERKEFKEEKLEGKFEKPENKDLIPDGKLPPERKPGKEQEIPDLPDPIDWRVRTLETRVSNLSHFILRSMRPDLSQGALHREPDVQDDTSDQEDS